MPRYCPTCGQRVRVHTEDDGTSFYEAVDSARIAELEAALTALAVNIGTALQFDTLDPAAVQALRPIRDVIESLVGNPHVTKGDEAK